MRDEVTLTATERNEVCTCTPQSVGLIGRLAHRHECTLHAQAVERILAERIAQARREGAAEAWDEGARAAQEWETRDLDGPSGDPPRNPYRGDA